MQGHRTTRRLALVLAVLLGSLAPAAQAGSRFVATTAEADVAFDRGRLAELGLTIVPAAKVRERSPFTHHAARLDGALAFDLARNHYATPSDGRLRMDVPLALGRGLRENLALSLVPWKGEETALALVDAKNAAWFTLDDVHQQFLPATGRLDQTFMDLRVGPALAARLKKPNALGLAVGVMHVKYRGDATKVANAVQACTDANWPGTPGFVADVAITSLPILDLRCIGALCNGSGTNPNSFVNSVPSVTLENVGTADMPWYDMFIFETQPGLSVPPGYPYGDTEQHPFLVWNTYRIDAQGRLEQIAGSGLKHAFGTQNAGPTCNCPSSSRILAPTCRDTYDYGSNELSQRLGPRDEIDPRTARWGRCQSTFDPDCDDDEDQNGVTSPTHRALTAESNFAAALNPGARYYTEVRYIVRDDVNPYNTMAYREFTPTFSSGLWTAPFVPATFAQGPVIDAWVPAGASTPTQRNVEVATAIGRLKVAARVTDLGNGQHRYDYAIYNLDLALVQTSGTEPDLRILSNRGVLGVRFPLQVGVTASAVESDDGNATEGDDWIANTQSNGVTFTGSELSWGMLHRFSFVADSAPVAGNATLTQDDPGGPGTFVAATLVPGAPPEPPLFADGFE